MYITDSNVSLTTYSTPVESGGGGGAGGLGGGGEGDVDECTISLRFVSQMMIVTGYQRKILSTVTNFIV